MRRRGYQALATARREKPAPPLLRWPSQRRPCCLARCSRTGDAARRRRCPRRRRRSTPTHARSAWRAPPRWGDAGSGAAAAASPPPARVRGQQSACAPSSMPSAFTSARTRLCEQRCILLAQRHDHGIRGPAGRGRGGLLRGCQRRLQARDLRGGHPLQLRAVGQAVGQVGNDAPQLELTLGRRSHGRNQLRVTVRRVRHASVAPRGLCTRTSHCTAAWADGGRCASERASARSAANIAFCDFTASSCRDRWLTSPAWLASRAWLASGARQRSSRRRRRRQNNDVRARSRRESRAAQWPAQPGSLGIPPSPLNSLSPRARPASLAPDP